MNRLAGRVIVITGAAGGFGQVLAELAAGRGARVVGADIDGDALGRAFVPMEQSGLAVGWTVADVTDADSLRRLAEFAVERFGRIDVLVNNAGVMPLAFFADHPAAQSAWHASIDVNVKGVLNGIVAVHDQMIKQGRGHIVNISSTYGNAGTEGSGVYSATKSAINVLSESLRIETQGRIKVSVIRPTGVSTTGLGGSIINQRAVIGMIGHHRSVAMAKMAQLADGTLPPEQADREQIGYFALTAHDVAEAILYVIDQPWGVSISDLTVRAAGEPFLL